MEIVCFIAGLLIGGIVASIIYLSIIKKVGTLRIVNGRPAQLDINSWDILNNKTRAYLQIIHENKDVDISQE